MNGISKLLFYPAYYLLLHLWLFSYDGTRAIPPIGTSTMAKGSHIAQSSFNNNNGGGNNNDHS